jgi:mRNA interferase MazF
MTTPQRGDLFWVNLDPTVGTEINKTRPAVIVSHELGNQLSPRVIVVPVTTKRLDRRFPFEVIIPAGAAGQAETSKALADQVRAIDKRRLGARIGALPPSLLAALDEALLIALGLDPITQLARRSSPGRS